MAKKSVVYVGSTNDSITPIVESKINQIPPYEDSGVKFRGKYKIQKSQNEFELKSQATRFYSCLIPTGSAAGNYSFPKSVLRFYATTMLLQVNCNTSPTEIIIYDGSTANPKFRGYFLSGEKNIVINFEGSPREFSGGNIIISIDSALAGLTNFVNVLMYGFDEQN